MKAVRSLLATYSDECHRARGSRAEMSNKPSNQSFPRKIRAGERFAGVSRALGFGNDERVNAEAKGPLGHERSQGAGGPPRLGLPPPWPLPRLSPAPPPHGRRREPSQAGYGLSRSCPFPFSCICGDRGRPSAVPSVETHCTRRSVCPKAGGDKSVGGTIGAAPGPLGSVNTNSHSAISGFKDPPGP